MKWLVTLPPNKDGVEETKVVESAEFTVSQGFATFFDETGEGAAKAIRMCAAFAPQTWMSVVEASE